MGGLGYDIFLKSQIKQNALKFGQIDTQSLQKEFGKAPDLKTF